MSIFGAIKNAIFGHKAEAAPAQPQFTQPTEAAPTMGQQSVEPEVQQAPATESEIVARLDSIAQSKGVQSNYKTSIVDLMKLLDLDSSMTNRISLAGELGYTGDTNDSATMNIWLHKQVMASLATRGQ